MASVYAVENINRSNGAASTEDGFERDTQKSEEDPLSSIDELPSFLRRMIRNSPTQWKKTFALLAVLTQIGFGGTIMTFITSSPAIGLIVGICWLIGDLIILLQPDFTCGVFLEVLLKDAKTAKKISENMFSSAVWTCVLFPCLATPAAWYFFIYPLATTKMLGESTYAITIVSGGLATVSVIPYSLLYSTQPLSDQVSLVHISKVKEYLSKIRDIILSDNGEDGVSLVDKLSHEQAKIEKWIIAINNGMTTFNSLMQLFLFINNLISLIIIGSLNSIGAIIFVTVVTLFSWVTLANGLYALVKPNMVWEQQKIFLLNDAKVILNLKFPKENFESWLNNHNANAARIFGTKLTFAKMRQTTGALTSVLGVVLYVLLREEFRRLV